MSKIDDLITEMCPNGVQVKALGDVGEFIRGNGLQKKDLTDEGIGAIHYGQVFTYYGTSAAQTKSFVDPVLAQRMRRAKPGNLVIATTSEDDEGVCKAVAWLGDEEIAVSGDAYVYAHALDPLYVAYFFQTEAYQSQKRRFITGTKLKRVSGADMARIKIPVPPLAIQREIASILDKTENLKAELEAELEAELDLRSRQYLFYRDQLLTFREAQRVRWIPMGEAGRFFRGKRFTKADYVDTGIPCIHYGEIYTEFGTSTDRVVSHIRPDLKPSLRFAQPGDVVIVDVGETVEDVGKAVAWLGDEEVAIHDHCYVFRPEMNPAFVSYYMQTTRFHADKAKHVARTKVKTLLMGGLAKVLMPVPSVAEQERIVAILDKFDALLNDLSIGLSAEINARRSQYQHYRDRLLTFDEAAA